MNKLILGDCLEVLQKIESESVDLCYIDPPFFSNRTYEVVWGDKGEIRSFEDRFSGGVEHYVAWLKERVQEIYRVLKPTGSLFLHCDYHANAEIKVYILNKIFGKHNFRNEIIWKRNNKKECKKSDSNIITDTIWWYSKSENYIFNKNTNSKIDNIWNDLKGISESSYLSQKPEYLLERIIKMASNENDTVLDCFLGGGTTIAVADRLNRNWIGIDQSKKAIEVTELRLQKQNAIFEKSEVNSLYLPLNKENILKFLKDHKDFLATKFHVNQIALFGSFAKNEQNPDSDVDLLVDFEAGKGNFFEMQELKSWFEKQFHRNIDLGEVKSIKEYAKTNILHHAIFIR
ncbi:MAG: hypothetical protein EAZ97_09410 [Bacteroidetes bacterium]|nr:MAG: hypothetical protein EAZ97_09410 [Bacteroidota bacterium]